MKMDKIRQDDLRIVLQSGGFPVRTKAGIAKAFGISPSTVWRYMTEMQDELGKRYPVYAIAQPSSNLTLISTAAFYDYMVYREALRDRNLRKSVPKYDAQAILKGLGISFEIAA